METVTILRALWRRRLLVAVVAVAAIVVGFLLSYRLSLPPESRKYEVGAATARILVDTPHSQVVDIAPKGSETTGARASLLANLMTEGEVQAIIARRAGLEPRQLFARSESAGAEPAPSGADRDRKAHVLTTRVVTNTTGEALPMVEIQTQAPDLDGAERLAKASVTGLNSYLDSKAAAEKVSEARRLRVAGLGAPQARLEIRGPGRGIAIGAALFVFLAGCGAILAFAALARGWRVAAQEERLEAVDRYTDMLDTPPDDDRFNLPTEGDFSPRGQSTNILTPLPGRSLAPMGAAYTREPSADDEADARSA